MKKYLIAYRVSQFGEMTKHSECRSDYIDTDAKITKAYLESFCNKIKNDISSHLDKTFYKISVTPIAVTLLEDAFINEK